MWMFHHATGELIPSLENDLGYEAIESPRERGKFIESKYSTNQPPPEYGINEIPVFDGSSWTIKPDYRNLRAWYKTDGKKVIVEDIGFEPDGEYSEIEPIGLTHPVWDTESWREKTELEIYDEVYEQDPVGCIEFYARVRRDERDKQIRSEQDMLDRYANEVAEGDTPTESASVISKRRKRIKALRAVPEQSTFPRSVIWPPMITN